MANIIREARLEDIYHVAAKMREADIEELIAARGDEVNPLVALRLASLRSDPCYSWCTEKGEPIAAYGFAKYPGKPEVGVPWLLGTPELNRHACAYLREARRILDEMLETRFRYLINFVYTKNKSSVKFLKALGFTMHDPEPYGVKGELFHRFDIGDEAVCVNNTKYDTLLTGGE